MEKRKFNILVPKGTNPMVVELNAIDLRQHGAETIGFRMFGGFTIRLVVSGTDDLLPLIRKIGWPME